MRRGKINFFDVLDKYKCQKGQYVKSVLGYFSSSVSIWPNKRPQSDFWGPVFIRGSPVRWVREFLPPALYV